MALFGGQKSKDNLTVSNSSGVAHTSSSCLMLSKSSGCCMISVQVKATVAKYAGFKASQLMLLDTYIYIKKTVFYMAL